MHGILDHIFVARFRFWGLLIARVRAEEMDKLKDAALDKENVLIERRLGVCAELLEDALVGRSVLHGDVIGNLHQPLADFALGGDDVDVIALEGEARVEEIARILGGIEVTAAQRDAAREMIDEYKN
jgi:hypothetical protein